MTRKALISGLQTSFLVALILSIAAFASIEDEGLQVAAGGLEMTLSADMTRGLHINFIALN